MRSVSQPIKPVSLMTIDELKQELTGARLIISVITDERGSLEIKRNQLVKTEPSTLEVRWCDDTMTIIHREDSGAGVSNRADQNETTRPGIISP